MTFDELFENIAAEKSDIDQAYENIMKDMKASRLHACGYWKGRIETWKDIIAISKAFVRELDKSKKKNKIEEGIYIAYKKQAKQFQEHCYIYETALHKVLFDLKKQ